MDMRFVNFSAAFIIAITMSGCDQAPRNATETEPRDNNILHDAKFMAENPKFATSLQTLILKAGFDCPALVWLKNKGETTLGLRLEALCGPDDGTGNAYSSLHYAIYPDRFVVHACSEFQTFGEDCK